MAPRLTTGGNDPERDLLRSERDGLVHAALQALPEGLREIIVLHDWQGLSHQEIADMLGEPRGTILSRLARGRAELAERVAAAGLADSLELQKKEGRS